MDDDRKKPLWPWIAALLIGFPVLYLASYGPVMWLWQREIIPPRGRNKWAIECVYSPVIELQGLGPDPIASALRWYQRLGFKRMSKGIVRPFSEFAGSGLLDPEVQLR